MRALRIVGRSIASSCRSIFRNFSLSMASITCTLITLVLVSIGILLTHNINSISRNMQDEVTIVVFMTRDIDEEGLKEVEKEFENIDNVKAVKFKSKDEIRDEFAKNNPAYQRIIESWGDDNFLLDSFIITVDDIKFIGETATTIRNMEQVDEVHYGESIARDLVRSLNTLKNASLILVACLILVTTFLIGNTIKITIFSRRNEIEIMRLVGTSNSVIKLPFLFEGFILGIAGAIVPVLITIFGYDYLYTATANISHSNMFRLIQLTPPGQIVYTTSLILLVIGALVGMIGSVRAVRKYLKI